ncbi:hypothetical protein BDV93DRAFT_529813 [Ceratobasidium sp. AG-I]|nr:hypothetical protein BDV93DRAFT_529813 [Ceratobasidium sp. AG-I]
MTYYRRREAPKFTANYPDLIRVGLRRIAMDCDGLEMDGEGIRGGCVWDWVPRTAADNTGIVR